MSMATIRIPPVLRPSVGGEKELSASGSSVGEILRSRCRGRTQGWVWQSRYRGKHVGAAMVNRQWVRARRKAGLPEHLVLYCARHDYGSFVLSKTGNMKVVMDLMGQSDYRTALKYQHHEVEVARELLNARHILRHTGENDRQEIQP